jgi:uncharacterized protein (TIGR00369 family)
MTTTWASGPADFSGASSALSRAFVDGRVDLARLHQVVDTMVPFNNFVGVRISTLDADGAVAEIPDDPRYLNHLGTVHAGALFLAAEVACAGAFAGAIAARLADLRFFVLRESKVWFLNPARGRVRASGSVDRAATREMIADRGERQFELAGTAMLRDTDNLLLARVSFDYLCVLSAPA